MPFESLHAPPFKTERPRTVPSQFPGDILVNSPEVVADVVQGEPDIVAGLEDNSSVQDESAGLLYFPSNDLAIQQWVENSERQRGEQELFFRNLFNHEVIRKLPAGAREACLKFVSFWDAGRARRGFGFVVNLVGEIRECARALMMCFWTRWLFTGGRRDGILSLGVEGGIRRIMLRYVVGYVQFVPEGTPLL